MEEKKTKDKLEESLGISKDDLVSSLRILVKDELNKNGADDHSHDIILDGENISSPLLDPNGNSNSQITKVETNKDGSSVTVSLIDQNTLPRRIIIRRNTKKIDETYNQKIAQEKKDKEAVLAKIKANRELKNKPKVKYIPSPELIDYNGTIYEVKRSNLEEEIILEEIITSPMTAKVPLPVKINDPIPVVKENKVEPVEETPIVEHIEPKIPFKVKWMNAWEFYWSHKRIFLPLLFSILGVILLGYLTSPIQRSVGNWLVALDYIGCILLTLISLFLILKGRKAIKEEPLLYWRSSIMFGVLFIYLFLWGLILTLLFRVISLTSPHAFINIGGLFSLFGTLIPLVIILLVGIAPRVEIFYSIKDKIFKKRKTV